MSNLNTTTRLKLLSGHGPAARCSRAGIRSGPRSLSTSSILADDRKPPSRAARSVSAAKEVSSFRITRSPVANPLDRPAGPPRGVDARGLAARPAVSQFVIHRKIGRAPAAGTGAQRSSPGNGGARGGFSRVPSFQRRDGQSPAFNRGAGGARGDFPGAAQGNRGGGRPSFRRGRKPDKIVEDPNPGDRPLTGPEWKALDAKVMGRWTAVVPPLEKYNSMDSHGVNVATASAPEGLRQTILQQMRIATRGSLDDSLVHPTIHLRRLKEGRMTVFENREQQQVIETVWLQEQLKSLGQPLEVRPTALTPFPTLSGKVKDVLAAELVAGEYKSPGWAEVGGSDGKTVLDMVRSLVGRNGSYHVGDQRKLENRLQRLLPDLGEKKVTL